MEKSIYLKNRKVLKDKLIVLKGNVNIDATINRLKKDNIIYAVDCLLVNMNKEYDNYLCFICDNNKIIFSYCEDKNGGFSNNRKNIKFGRYLNKYYNWDHYITDYIFKNITALLMPNKKFDNLINILSGKDILDHYKTGFKTCMTGLSNSSKLVLYRDNPEKVKLLTVEGYNCRALIWKTDDGMNVLDRIYPAGHSLIPTIRKWAVDNGYLLRSHADSYINYSRTIALSDDSLRKITLKNTSKYPFLDTFVFAEIDKDNIIISNDIEFGDMVLQNQHGEYIKYQRCECCNRKTLAGDGYEFEGKKYCSHCYSKYVVRCSCCANYSLKENCIIANKKDNALICKTCIKSNYIKCLTCDEYFHKNTIKKVNTKELCMTCYNKVYTRCACCKRNDLVKDSDETKKVGDNYFCTKCYKEIKECSECGKAVFRKGSYKIIKDKVFCSFCARYKIKDPNKTTYNHNYLDHAAYKEVMNYAYATNINVGGYHV